MIVELKMHRCSVNVLQNGSATSGNQCPATTDYQVVLMSVLQHNEHFKQKAKHKHHAAKMKMTGHSVNHRTLINDNFQIHLLLKQSIKSNCHNLATFAANWCRKWFPLCHINWPIKTNIHDTISLLITFISLISDCDISQKELHTYNDFITESCSHLLSITDCPKYIIYNPPVCPQSTQTHSPEEMCLNRSSTFNIHQASALPAWHFHLSCSGREEKFRLWEMGTEAAAGFNVSLHTAQCRAAVCLS